MKSKSLGLKFLILGVMIGLFITSLAFRPLKKGIDLEGGHSLIFQIKTEAGENTTDLPERIIEILKKRVDPNGLMNLEWRPAGRDRIEIRMPEGSNEARQGKLLYVQALESLEATNLKPGDIRQVVTSTGEQRKQIIAQKAGPDAGRAALLTKAAELHDQIDQEWNKIQPQLEPAQAQLSKLKSSPTTTQSTEQVSQVEGQIEKIRGKYDNLRADYADTLDKIRATNLSTRELGNVFDLYVSSKMAEQMPASDVTQRKEQLNTRLAEMKRKFPYQAQQIENAFELYKTWADARGRLDDPQDLVRLIRRAGVLEFRMAPRLGNEGFTISQQTAEQYANELKQKGPGDIRESQEPYHWYKIHGSEEKLVGLITATYNGERYVLLSNQPSSAMLRKKDAPVWNLVRSYPTSDDRGAPAVGFEFDDKGAQLFAALTGSHVGDEMAVLLDDEVYSAPRIITQISKSGQITGKFSSQEVSDLVRTLESGSLPARLDPNPVSVNSIGATLGKTNIERGLKAGYYGAIGVVIFMTLYYLYGGLIANVALSLNLLFVLGSMALFEATFTLPGIAGVILTLGMAVDANVLIFERWREEQAKGLSIRAAMHNAYSRAMSAIIDTHLTTIITCAILGWVGTTEVKGFAITLGLGIIFSLFTAVFVTRWIFEVLINIGLVKGKLPMLRLIGVPKINWMSKRYYFWAFSIITGILGMTAFFWQGRDILGIEFRSGTRAVVRFLDDATINGKPVNDELVADRLAAMADQLGIKSINKQDMTVNELRTPNYVDDFITSYDGKSVGGNEDGKISKEEWTAKGRKADYFDKLDTNKDGILERSELTKDLPEPRYQLTTAESRPDVVRKAIDEAFSGLLNVQSKVDYQVLKDVQIPGLNAKAGSDGIARITPELAGASSADFREAMLNYTDGAMIAFTINNPAQALTLNDLQERLRTTRMQVGRDSLAVADTDILPLVPVQGTNRFSAFAVLVRSDDLPVGDNESWKRFADDELSLVEDSLSSERSLESLTNFDPAMTKSTSQRAVIAVVLSWMAIIVYLWFRFGGLKWGLGAVICLIHDTLIILGLIALSGWVCTHIPGVSKALLIEPFKIDMTMIAAILTVIGYSVSDTIVVFDRIRENRGRLTAVSPNMINASVNQTLSRTILTVCTTLIVVTTMYIWGGDGIHGFNFALLAGILFGTYSSIAVASPILLIKRRIGNAIAASGEKAAAK